jgi:nucleoside-diphosphate-sugar epimerase
MQKILITGTSGYLGSNLINKLSHKKYNILGVDKKKNLNNNKHVKFLQTDIRKLKIPKSFYPDVIIHVGSLNSEKFYKKNPIGSYNLDINSTLKILEIASVYKVKNLIFASSEWVYGDHNKYKILKENTLIEKSAIKSFHALSKIISEDLIKIFYENKLIKNYIILRLGIFYGKRKKPNSAVEGIFNDIKNNKEVIINGSLKSSRKFIHVDDISQAIIKSINLKKPHTLNIAGTSLISLKEIIKNSATILKKNYLVKNYNKNNLVVRNVSNKLSKKILRCSPSISFINGIKKLLH